MSEKETDEQAAAVVIGVDGKPTNMRFQNMFEEEVILTEKQMMRRDLVENKDKMKDTLKTMSPTDIFLLFDEDDSGLISFNEFRKMLPFLDINISDAKAFRYFRMCDTDGSGEIDIDEFQVALFTCDPTSGNPVGFKPSKNLTAMDAFEMFDEDQSGFLDEDEYRFALEYLGIKASEEITENSFFEADRNNLGKIDFFEFREIFIKLCDVRKELEDRDIDTPQLIRKSKLQEIFREVLLEEEQKERQALAEAKRFKQWLLNVRDSKKILQKAEFRAYQELRSALDAAGHVYVIGSGSYGQFDQSSVEGMKTDKFEFEHYEKILELWKDRVRPEQLVERLKIQRRAQEQDEKRDEDRELTGLSALAKEINNGKRIVIDPYVEAQESPFIGLNVALNTAALWGKRVHQVAIGENVIFALADTGEIYTWGGNSYWWHEIQADSIYQTKWRGDTTPRSQLLLGTKEKTLPPDVSVEQSFDFLSPDDKKVEMVKVVAKYYNVWEPPPNAAQRIIFIDKDILPKISYDQVKFSRECRGKEALNMTKMELIDALFKDIILEKRLLGERAHKAIREIETQVAGLLKRKKTKLAQKFLKRIEEMWLPLREVQAENQAAEIAKEAAAAHQLQLKSASNYIEWRDRVGRKREQTEPEKTPRGNGLKIDLLGVTPRGPGLVTPRGYQAGSQIAAGSSHACLLHKSGQLYTWGVGAAGRLGLDLTENGDPQGDASRPRLVQALAERPVLRVSCGYSHTGAIVSGGELYMWGSTVSGKCGFGRMVNTEECFCSIPTKVLVGVEDRRIKKLSCGSSHSAVITEAGLLYMFGCGDGGRLGLGVGDLGTRFVPTFVEALAHVRVASVSCGNSTSIVCTEIGNEWIGDVENKHRKFTGGDVYIAGSGNVFGKQYEVFTKLKVMTDAQIEAEDSVHIKQVSAGYLHSVLVSADGEVYCWGHNRSGCCGAPLVVKFVDKPTPVPFLYTKPLNLALGKNAYQSSTYNMREAKYAVNGQREGFGVNKCTCTQHESQPWIEIDLGQIAMIDKVIVWNRTDAPIDKNQEKDLYTSRLFPCWVMVGRNPFVKTADVYSLKESLRSSVCKAKLTENKRVSTWRCPANAQGRYVRVQLEKYNTLSVAQIEVYGYAGYTKGVGRVSYASGGRDVTVVVVRPSNDPRDIEFLYKRAAYADAANADILRQLETYMLEYDKYGRGEVLSKDCCICRGMEKCESCIAYETFHKEILSMPPVIGGRRRRLKSISEFLINSNKPELEPVFVPKLERPSKFQMRLQAIMGDRKFNFGGFFKKPAPRSFISPQEALKANPDAMLQQLKFIENIEEKQAEKQEDEKSLKSSVDNNSRVRRKKKKKDKKKKEEPILPQVEENEEEQDISITTGGSSMGQVEGDSSVKDFSAGSNFPKRRMKVGDVLPTGQVVRSAFPKNIAERGGKKYVEDSEWNRQRQEAKEAEEKERRRPKLVDLGGKK